MTNRSGMRRPVDAGRVLEESLASISRVKRVPGEDRSITPLLLWEGFCVSSSFADYVKAMNLRSLAQLHVSSLPLSAPLNNGFIYNDVFFT